MRASSASSPRLSHTFCAPADPTPRSGLANTGQPTPPSPSTKRSASSSVVSRTCRAVATPARA